MQERKEKLLQLVVETHLQTAEPVGSKFLIDLKGLEYSGATVRNEMRDLENEGYLTHPHTSAGRVPTEKGYLHYIENIMQTAEPDAKAKKDIAARSKADNRLKELAKYASEYISAAVIVALNENNIYYTGISNLFSQPEFRDYAHTVSISSIFDECETRIGGMYDRVNTEVETMIGDNNPLGSACSSVAVKIGEESLFVILGPKRMDYAKAIGLLKHIKTVI